MGEAGAVTKPPVFLTVPLGEGRVNVGFVTDSEGRPGILLHALKEPQEIGSKGGTPDNFGVFIRCPKPESAAVLQRAVQKLCDSFDSSTEQKGA